MSSSSDYPTSLGDSLKLLLFVDRRPSSREQVRAIQARLSALQTDYPFSLETIDVVEQPYMAEHFRLVATPALVRIFPEPRQIVAGSDLLAQFDRCWSHWQELAEEVGRPVPGAAIGSTAPPAELLGTPTGAAEWLRLSDEMFRLEREKADLKGLLRFKDRAIEMLVHDLRNPLAAVSVAVETLQAGMDPSRIQSAHMTEALRARILGRAREQLQVIDRLVTQLLQAAQGDRAKIKIQPQPLDLGALCTELIEQVRDRLESKQQAFSADIPQDLPLVYADHDGVRQVLTNLLDNAIKYTPPEGEIQLALLHRTTQTVQVSLADTGPGIAKADWSRIFDEGVRLERDAAIDGYGLGLATCQQIVRAHYGELWVDSEPGQGSCFYFTLPVYR